MSFAILLINFAKREIQRKGIAFLRTLFIKYFELWYT